MTSPHPSDRLINAPWPAVALAASLPCLYVLQRLSPDEGRLVGLYGLVPADLWAGRIVGLFTSLGLHGDWRHVGLNALGVLVFGTPVARRLGESARGALSLLAFFVLCGLLAGLAFAAMNPATQAPVIGASGGAFGLIGAATRLMGRPGSAPAPLFSRPVLLMSAAWIGTNLLLAIPFASPGGMTIAWEAHVAGFIAGLVLIGPWPGAAGGRTRAPA